MRGALRFEHDGAVIEAEPVEIIVCQGPPTCALSGMAAYEAQVAGCPWCRREIVAEDGIISTTDPMARPQ